MTNDDDQPGAPAPESASPRAGSTERRHSADAAARARNDRRQRRRIDEIFGDSMPQITDDERDPGEHDGFTAEHYRRGRPPHHVG